MIAALAPMSIREAADSLAKAAKGYQRAIRSATISFSDALELERRFNHLRTVIEIAVVCPGETIELSAADADLLAALSASSEGAIRENVRANKPTDTE